jgi:hypothetical protein
MRQPYTLFLFVILVPDVARAQAPEWRPPTIQLSGPSLSVPLSIVPRDSAARIDANVAKVLTFGLRDAQAPISNNHVANGILIGAAVGAVAGAVIGYSMRVGCQVAASAPPPGLPQESCSQNGSHLRLAITYGALGGAGGAAVGALVGKLWP